MPEKSNSSGTYGEPERHSARIKAIKRIANAIERDQDSKKRFLQAWLKGVKKIGWQYFQYQSPIDTRHLPRVDSIEEVIDKLQAMPDCKLIRENIGSMSSGESALLAAMCSIFNANWGGELMREVGINGLADLSRRLDEAGTDVVSELLINYRGW